jgi:glucokinase
VSTLAIDIGGTKFTIALLARTSEGVHIVRQESRLTDRAGGRERLLPELSQLARDWSLDAKPASCGIGFGGPVDFAAQRVALSTHVAGWEDFPLRDYFQDLLGIPAVIDNDANAGALGEALYGAGVGSRPLVYVTLSTGIGGGLVLEGDRVYRGADSWAGEIGHITLDPDGRECLCGARGCFERICSGLWLERDYGRPAHDLLADPDFAARYAAQVARGLKAAVMLLNPARIVIGGGIAQAGDRLLKPLRQELRWEMTTWSGARVDVQLAALGNASVLWGAYALAARVAGFSLQQGFSPV